MMLDTIEATHQQVSALDHLKKKRTNLDDFMKSESARLRQSRKVAEATRIGTVKEAKENGHD